MDPSSPASVSSANLIQSIDMRRLIIAKKHGQEHGKEELSFLIQGVATGSIPDYQITAWLMAVYWRGLSQAELVILTELMRYSGISYDFQTSSKDGPVTGLLVDKHSTGGVGDKLSFLFAPLAVCLGFRVPMIAGRTLGHTGGTIDKLESIPGYRVDIEAEQRLLDFLNGTGMFIVGQSKGLCPADRRLYALRDVTETVDQQGLICASIVSKKLAEGTEHVVYDVKCGSGAFMPDLDQARSLAVGLVNLSRHSGLKAAALITDMNMPLGRWVGNSAELIESIEILKGQYASEKDRALSASIYQLTVRLLYSVSRQAGDSRTLQEIKSECDAAISSGKAFEVFEKSCKQQGAALGFAEQLTIAPLQAEICADRDGFVHALDAGALGRAGLLLGMGRLTQEDKISHTNNFEILQKRGDYVTKGSPLVRIYAADHLMNLNVAKAMIRQSISIDSQACANYAEDLVLEEIQ